jgi:hypothetical protein
MANKNELPEEAGNVNWNKMFNKPSDSNSKKRVKKTVDVEEEVKEAQDKLTKKEKSFPYPDDFLADVNVMIKKSGMNNMKSNNSDEEE